MVVIVVVIASVEFLHSKLDKFPFSVKNVWDLAGCHTLGPNQTPIVRVFSRRRNSIETLYLKPSVPNSNRKVPRIFRFFQFLAASQMIRLPLIITLC